MKIPPADRSGQGFSINSLQGMVYCQKVTPLPLIQKWLSPLLPVAMAALCAPAIAESYQVAGATAVSVDSERGVQIYNFRLRDGTNLKISILDTSTARVQWDLPPITEQASEQLLNIEAFSSPVRVTISESNSHFTIETSSMGLMVSKTTPLQVSFRDQVTGEIVSQDEYTDYDRGYSPLVDASYKDLRFSGAPPSGFGVRCVRALSPNTAFFGLGDWAGPINRRGHLIQFWPDDAWGWSPNHSPKYTSFPIFYAVSPRHSAPPSVWALFFNNPSRTVFDMGKSEEKVISISAAAGPVDYFFFLSPQSSFQDILERITRLTGRPALLPKWAYGYQASRYSYTQSELSEVLSGFAHYNIPLSAAFLDIGYMNHAPNLGLVDYGGLDHWDIRQLSWGQSFPRPTEIISSLAERGIATVALVEPFLTPQDPLFREATAAGYFIQNQSGDIASTELWLSPEIAWIDFTNTAASSWWESKLSAFCRKYDIRGIWNDLNEIADHGGVPLDAPLAFSTLGTARSDPRRWHLRTKPLLSIHAAATSFRALTSAHPAERPYVLSRGGYPGIQRWSAGWSGDNQATDDHLPAAIRSSASVGISGWSNYGHDVGGFYGDPSLELLERWFEWSALAPSMRNHYSKWSSPREPMKFAEPARSRLIGSIRLRYFFLPHLYSLAFVAHETGWPILSPVVAAFPSDIRTFSESDNDFMLGTSMLVAPVVEANTTRRQVYFPSSGFVWRCFWTSRAYPAGTKWELSAPLGRPLIFLRPLAIVPLSPTALKENATSPSMEDLLPREIEIHIWSGVGRNEYLLYDDDGVSTLETEDASRSNIAIRVVSVASGSMEVEIRSQMSENKRLRLVFRSLPRASYKLTVNGDPAPVEHLHSPLDTVDISSDVTLGEQVSTFRLRATR